MSAPCTRLHTHTPAGTQNRRNNIPLTIVCPAPANLSVATFLHRQRNRKDHQMQKPEQGKASFEIRWRLRHAEHNAAENFFSEVHQHFLLSLREKWGIGHRNKIIFTARFSGAPELASNRAGSTSILRYQVLKSKLLAEE